MKNTLVTFCIDVSKTFSTFIFRSDLPPSFAICWEPHNRTGKHQKTQVSPTWLDVIQISSMSSFSMCDPPHSSPKHILQFTHVYSVKEIHHIDDNDFGGIHSKVRHLDFSHCSSTIYIRIDLMTQLVSKYCTE